MFIALFSIMCFTKHHDEAARTLSGCGHGGIEKDNKPSHGQVDGVGISRRQGVREWDLNSGRKAK
jgi:hypothetical protein